MEVKAYIKEIVLFSIWKLCIFPAQHHADHTAGVFHIAEPCTFSVERHIRKTFSKIICLFHAFIHVKNRMGFSKGHSLFHKSKHAGIFSKSPPVDPANGIILTICIVISALGIADLIAPVDHRHSLGKQQHGKSSPHLPLPHLADPLLPARSLNAAVPGIIVAAAIVIALTVCLVMLIIIGNKVIQGKSILTSDIIDYPMIIRIMTDPVLYCRNHVLVTFQESAHILEESKVILCEATLISLMVLIKGRCIHSICHHLRSCKQTILHDQIQRCTLSQNMKTVHMIILFPELQSPQRHQRICLCREIHFHNAANPCLMKSLDHIAKFFMGILCDAISTFGCKIVAISIAPVIYFVLFAPLGNQAIWLF